jgi:hypothetical protein
MRLALTSASRNGPGTPPTTQDTRRDEDQAINDLLAAVIINP